MRVSVTERQLYKRCRRKWNFASYNRQSLTPLVNAPALDLGTLIHAVLAEWTSDSSIDPIQLYKQRAQEYFQTIIDSYVARIGCAPAETELEPTSNAIMLGLGMISNYKDRWHTALPPGFTLIENELTLVQDVEGTATCSCFEKGRCTCPEYSEEGRCFVFNKDCTCRKYQWQLDSPNGKQPLHCSCLRHHQLECTFDGVMADENGDLYIIERKTFSRTPSIDELNTNDQFLAYQWALSNKLPNVVGVAYDGLLKKLKPPAGKTMDDLFLRRILLRNNHELTEFHEQLVMELNEMGSNPAIYKTVPPVQGCQRWECSFLDICKAMSKGEPYDHMLRMFSVSDRKKHLEVDNG